jgi:glycosyltransferase involved in cell wall biosynthesis
VKDVIPGIQFRLMGEGEYLPALRARAEMLGIASRLQYLGFVPFETMIEEILSADATVVAMHRSSYSALVHTNKMYEYIALERPVIASRLESVSRYFPEDTLVYFEPGDEDDLARRLLHVLTNPVEMRRRVGRTSEVYNSFRWEHQRKNYLAVYDELLTGVG